MGRNPYIFVRPRAALAPVARRCARLARRRSRPAPRSSARDAERCTRRATRPRSLRSRTSRARADGTRGRTSRTHRIPDPSPVRTNRGGGEPLKKPSRGCSSLPLSDGGPRRSAMAPSSTDGTGTLMPAISLTLKPSAHSLRRCPLSQESDARSLIFTRGRQGRVDEDRAGSW